MSVEADFRAALAAHAPLVTLVAQRIALNAVPAGAAYPLVTYVVQHSPDVRFAGGTPRLDACTVSVQCWADKPDGALAVAAEVKAALAASATAQAADATVVEEATGFDEELELDAVQLTVEWWQYAQ